MMARNSPPNASCTCFNSRRLICGRGRPLVTALLMATSALKSRRLPAGRASRRASRPFCKFFRTKGTRLTYVILYFGKASRTYSRSEEHTSELQSRLHLVCRLLLEKKKKSGVHTLLHVRLDTENSTDAKQSSLAVD